MKQTAILLLLLLSMLSCKTTQLPLQTTKETIIKDTTFTVRKVIDTVQVLRPADTAKISLLISKLSAKPTVVQSKIAKLTLRKVGNTIQGDCECPELKEAVQIYKETTTRQREIITQQQEIITLIKKEIPALLKPLIWLGGGTLFLLIGSVVIRLFKPKIL